MDKMTNLLYFYEDPLNRYTPNFEYLIHLFNPGISENRQSVTVFSRLTIGPGGRSQSLPSAPIFLTYLSPSIFQTAQSPTPYFNIYFIICLGTVAF